MHDFPFPFCFFQLICDEKVTFLVKNTVISAYLPYTLHSLLSSIKFA